MRTDMKYIDSLSGRQFEKWVYKLFGTDPRYNAKLTPASHDFGADVIITDKYHPEYHHFMIAPRHFYNPDGISYKEFRDENNCNDTNLGYYKRTYGIQCKHADGTAIGYRAVEEAVSGGKYYNTDGEIVLTNGLFTNHARNGAKRTGVRLFNRDSLEELVDNYYQDLGRNMELLSNKKASVDLDSNLKLDMESLYLASDDCDDFSSIIWDLLDSYYNKLNYSQRINVLSIYDKLLNNNK